MKLNITTLFLFFYIVCAAQTLSSVNELPRPTAAWEVGFQKRINEMWGKRIPAYLVEPNRNLADAGKWEWGKLLALMSSKTTNYNVQTMKSWVANGREMVNGQYTGSFQSPFSCAGYAMYYFHWKDSIAKYDPTQITLIHSKVNGMWPLLLKTDHVFDPCCGYNEGGGKEFNSENFHWMMRAAGYLFAHELHNKTVDSQKLGMTKLDLSQTGILIHTGLDSPPTKTVYPTNVDAIAFFDGFLKNLTRALYNAGRVEWNSNNYFGHTLNPLLTIYEGADKCNDPTGIENKKRAEACIDWMLVEAAVHYLDGAQVAADARAKTASFLPFRGSYFQYTIPYFADELHYPSFHPAVWDTKDPTEMEVGFLTSSSYRPPQIIIDLAQRTFPLPVEIQSAKPFYHLDKGKYFNPDGSVNGELPYADWNGTNRGRRFEFETLWLDKNLTMASAAVGRPDGNLGTFSEQCMWRIGVKGQKAGVRMLSGNAGERELTAGRSPEHEIGQFRNTMMQMIRKNNVAQNRIWIAIPDSLKQMRTVGKANFWDVLQYRWLKNDLYLNMGNGVYIVLKPFPAPLSVTIDTTYSESPEHARLQFGWAANVLGSVTIEVATDVHYRSFNQFVSKLKCQKVNKENDTTYCYTSDSDNTLKMQYMPTISYKMTPYTFDTPPVNPFLPAGTYPKIWGNGNYIDYQTWDSYRTVFGHDLINQKWGSGTMTLQTQQDAARISVDPITAEVEYKIGRNSAVRKNTN